MAISIAIVAFIAAHPASASPAPVDFNKEIRPILNAHCLKCHGGVKKAGELSLLFRAEALKAGKSGKPAIVPGDPAHSEFMARIRSADPDERMPKKADALPPADIAKLERWIAGGAEWADHWSYVPPKRHAPPATKFPTRTAVDAFLFARLEQEKLAPSPEADRATLLRRVSLDLTGLPPTPAEVSAFLASAAPDAYEQQVDRLLASPHFGERWASWWMDLARYADSKGYEKDGPREMWPYRDWLIDAFNRDLPFDAFTVEQLAGDLLPDPTEDQRIATAFHRNTMNNDEGGTDDEEFRIAAVLDRANSTMEIWNGESWGCIQCHSHPYDPFLHREYYELMAFFNQSQDSDKPNDQPVRPVLERADRARAAELESRRAALQQQGAQQESDPAFQAALVAWLKAREPVGRWMAPQAVTVEATGGATYRMEPAGSFVAVGENPLTNSIIATITAGSRPVEALRLDVIPDPAMKSGGVGRSRDGNIVLSRIQVAPSTVVAAWADHEQPDFGVEHALRGERPAERGWAVGARVGEAHHAVFVLGQPLPPGQSLRVQLDWLYNQPAINNQCAPNRFRLLVSDEPALRALATADAAVRPALLKPAEQRTPAEQAALRKSFAGTWEGSLKLQRELAEVEKSLAGVKKISLPVMAELSAAQARKTQIFNRGNFLNKGDEVSARTPGALQAWPAGAPTNRLGLARWLVSPDGPLTARVTVNRFWEQLFGIGIVETLEDFGTQGERPVHPELLDDLAVRFQTDMKWSMKSLLRELVISAAYRQASKVTPALLERDPRNRLLARGPRFRLTAEQLRDQALAASGLLSARMYGEPSMPFQPPGIWLTPYDNRDWATSPGSDAYRRALYTHWRRSSPYPSMLNFDGAARDVCVSRRLRTNTPLQALNLLNDRAYLDCAAAMARTMAAEGAEKPEAAVAGAMLRLLGRPPREGETRNLLALRERARAEFAGDPAAAKKFGDSPDHAAWMLVANALLNLDEVVTKQ